MHFGEFKILVTSNIVSCLSKMFDFIILKVMQLSCQSSFPLNKPKCRASAGTFSESVRFGVLALPVPVQRVTQDNMPEDISVCKGMPNPGKVTHVYSVFIG